MLYPGNVTAKQMVTVMAEGGSKPISYEYTFEDGKKLLDYRLEQQAQIIADCFLLRKFGLKLWLDRRGLDREVSYVVPVDSQLNTHYQKVLEGFPLKGRQ